MHLWSEFRVDLKRKPFQRQEGREQKKVFRERSKGRGFQGKDKEVAKTELPADKEIPGIQVC